MSHEAPSFGHPHLHSVGNDPSPPLRLALVDRVPAAQAHTILACDLFHHGLVYGYVQVAWHEGVLGSDRSVGRFFVALQGLPASRVQLASRVVQSSGFALLVDISPRSSGSASGTQRER